MSTDPFTQPITPDPMQTLKEGPVSSFQYIPHISIPQEVHAAAKTLSNYFEQRGTRYWVFSHVADRRLVEKLEREIEVLRAQVSAAQRDVDLPSER